MNRHKVFDLRDRNELQSLFPAISKEKADVLLSFLDVELECEGPLDKETLLVLLDQAAREPLGQKVRECILEFLRVREDRHSKTKLVSLARDVLRIKAMHFNPTNDTK